MLLSLSDLSVDAPVVELPRSLSTVELSARCRKVALELMEGAPTWSKRDVSRWLSLSYASVAVALAPEDAAGGPIPLLRDIDGRMLSRLLLAARAEVRGALARPAEEGVPAFVRDAVGAGLVVRCQDDAGRIGFAPTYGARRLGELVLALFAADCLVRPADYEDGLVACRYCDRLSFDADVRENGHCAAHVSTFAARASRAPYSTFPDGA